MDATTGQLILTLSMPFSSPDGSLAGAVGMDIKITHALLESETSSRWSQKMSTFIVSARPNSLLAERKIKASTLRASYPNYHISKNKISLTPEINVDLILSEVEKKYSNQEINTVDGLKIDFDRSHR